MARPRFEPEDDEDVLLETGPHWLRLVPRLALPSGLLAACVAGFVLWTSAPVWFGWFLLVLLAVAVGIGAGRVLSWRATSFVVTSSRILYRHGVLGRTGRELPVSRIQDVSYRQSVLSRLAGIGVLRLETAGAGSAEEVGDLRHPADVQRLVNRAVDAALRPRPAATAGADLAGQLERLDLLRRRGIVTEAEFAQKKAELLARM